MAGVSMKRLVEPGLASVGTDTECSAADAAAVTSDSAPESPMSRVADGQAPIRKLGVLVGSDDPFTRQAFRTGASAPGIEVLGDGTLTAVSEVLAARLEPEIVLLDVQTGAAEALLAIQQVHARAAGARILACSAPAGTEFGLLCLSAGAWGYVSKEIDLAVLPQILHALASGEAVIPQALATELVKRFVRSDAVDRSKPAELSPPESRLLELLRTGFTLPEAASELAVTLATARRHFGRVRRKLSVPPPGSNSKSHDGGDRNHEWSGR
jgi:DNA-binding NarL/FixJ family response regulator